MEEKAFQISKTALQKLVVKAYNLSRDIPKNYPTVDEIDTLLESEEYKEPQIKEDAFKLFVLCIISGYPRDYVWHKLYPGHKHINSANLIFYLFTPVTGSAALQNHCNIWEDNMSEEEKTDRQAAFEYIQSIVMDQSMYVIYDDDKLGFKKTKEPTSATFAKRNEG